MARPKKDNADYFPHDSDLRNDRRCKALRSKFNLEGYAVFVMLLEILTGANHFQIENNKMEVELIAGDIDIDSKKLNAILDHLIRLGLLVKEGGVISSPMLNDLKKILSDVREKDRKRKNPENPTKENSTKENRVFQPEKEVIRTENTQSKVKESKGNKSKRKEIKEKGVKKNTPPIFLNDFSEKQKTVSDPTGVNAQAEPSKEKSSAKKESVRDASLGLCKQIFLIVAPYYVWESKDTDHLRQLLQKILITKPNLATEADFTAAFQSFLQKLPDYWRTKKFTISNMNSNYNEIVSEIRAKQKTQPKQVIQRVVKSAPEVKQEVSEEDKKRIRKDFIKSICECYERFAKTGEHGYMQPWVMYDTLVEHKILKLSEKKMDEYRKRATDQRKRELSQPKDMHEARTFKALLATISSGLSAGNELHNIEREAKSLAVDQLFKDLKKKKTDIKTLFKNTLQS